MQMREYRFDDIWREYGAYIIGVRELLTEACNFATNLVDSTPKLAKDPILWASLVRARLAVSIPDFLSSSGCYLEQGFNISLTMQSEYCSFRMLKAKVDEMPDTFSSVGRRSFCNQNRVEQFSLFGTELIEAPEFAPNFLLVWHTDEYQSLCGLDLAYPKPCLDLELGLDEQTREWYWIQDVFELQFDNLHHSVEDYEDIPGLELTEESEEADDEETGN